MKKTKDTQSTRFGHDIPFGQLDIDESAMSCWIPFASGKNIDSVGDYLEIGGIDTSRHIKMPLALFNHGKEVVLPIGLTCERDESGKYDYRKYTVVKDAANEEARMNVFFYQGKGFESLNGSAAKVARKDYDEHAVFCEQLFHMLAQRLLGAGSIGYQVIESRPIQPDYRRGTPQGLHLIRVLMLEGSVAVLPANEDTVRKVLSMDRVCGKSLSPVLVKSLEPYAGEKKSISRSGFSQGKNMNAKAFKVNDPVEASWLSGGVGVVTGVNSNGTITVADHYGGMHRNLDPNKVSPASNSSALARQRQADDWNIQRRRDGKKNIDAELDDDINGTQPVPIDNDIPMNEILDEPMGAKVLRRMYEDAKALEQEWGETLPVLADNPNIKRLIENKLKMLGKERKEYMKAWTREKAYKELDPLDMDGDGDVDEVDEALREQEEDEIVNPEEDLEEADVVEEAELTEDDIPEGMEEEYEEPTPEEVIDGMDKFPDDNEEEYEEEIEKSYKRLKSQRIKALLNRSHKSKALSIVQKKMRKMAGEDDETENVENLPDLAEGKAFLKALSEDGSEFDEEARMKAYYYAKSWANAKPTGKKGIKCDDDMDDMQPYKSLRECAKFLKELSRSKDFGNRHREGCKYYSDQLEDKEENDAVGTMGEKMLSEQNRDLRELRSLISGLS